MSQRPNIILIMTDQQRHDTIAESGFPYMITPNLDKLVREGTSFDNCFCAAPSCVPSRACFFNCKYPHEMKTYNNAHRWTTSWVESLHDAGYQCINVGKMHTVPLDARCGFDQRYIVENKSKPKVSTDAFLDEWDKFLLWNHVEKPDWQVYYRENPDFADRLGAYEWPLDEELYSDKFVANMAECIIDRYNGERPLFLQIGFPGPHPPYDPPKRYIDRYDGVEFPVPCVKDEEMDQQPPYHEEYRKKTERANLHWKKHPAKEELQRLWKHYAANVTLIDEQVGSILKKCDERGILDNAIVVFTSDHGEHLGEHGHIQKWTMYDCATRIPAVIYSKNDLIPRNKRISGIVQQMDLAAAVLELAGVKGKEASATSALPMILGDVEEIRECVYAEHAASNRPNEKNYFQMIRTKEYKLVLYNNSDAGELYDLVRDPKEEKNLFEDEDYAQIRSRLTKKLYDFMTR